MVAGHLGDQFDLAIGEPGQVHAVADEVVAVPMVAAVGDRHADVAQQRPRLEEFACVGAELVEGLEFIDRVAVDRVERHALHLSVFTRTPWGQLKDLFDLDGRLVALSAASFGLGDEIPVLWRDGSR